MKGKTLVLALTAAAFVSGMALAQIAEAAQAAPPAPLAQAAASAPKGLGIGVRYGFLGNVVQGTETQLSMRMNMDGIAISPYLGFGFSHIINNNKTDIAMGIRILPTIAKTKQATFSALIGVGGVIGEDADWELGVDAVGGFGVEYFFAGLPELGFSLEGGLDINLYHTFAGDGDTCIGLSTVGSTFSGGVHYYFN